MSFITEQYVGMAADGAIFRERSSAIRAINRVTDSLEVTEGELAHALATRSSLQEFIKNIVGEYHSDIPLLTNLELRNQIGKAGRLTWNSTRNWDSVKEAGRKFPVPIPSDLFKNYVVRALHDQLQNKFQHAIEKNKEILELNLKLRETLHNSSTCVLTVSLG